MDFILVTTSKTFDINNKCQIVGGIQTYTHDLCLLAKEKGYRVFMYQLDNEQADASSDFDGIEFHIIHKVGKNNQAVFDRLYNERNHNDAIFVVSTDQMNIKSRAKNVIVIQHGIAFDCPIEEGLWSRTRFLQHLNKFLRCIQNVRRMYWSSNTVGVDYNYFNWFRTLGIIYPEKRFRVIPNYSSGYITKEELEKKMELSDVGGKLKIVFARRFCTYRGTIIFANCIDRLLSKFPELDFTFAGEGELKEELKNRYRENARVHITSFLAPESIEFHKQYDIAVVPTIFSEGTSLSLLEAMSAGCFPVATHVGGMTNIILDHYNGLLCFPDEDGVYDALQEAITMNKRDFKKIVENAYYSATQAFSVDQWKKRWSFFLDEVMTGYVKKEQ